MHPVSAMQSALRHGSCGPSSPYPFTYTYTTASSPSRDRGRPRPRCETLCKANARTAFFMDGPAYLPGSLSADGAVRAPGALRKNTRSTRAIPGGASVCLSSLCLLHLQRLDFGLLTVCRCCRRQPRDPIRKHAAGKMTDGDLDTCACFCNQKNTSIFSAFR